MTLFENSKRKKIQNEEGGYVFFLREVKYAQLLELLTGSHFVFFVSVEYSRGSSDVGATGSSVQAHNANAELAAHPRLLAALPHVRGSRAAAGWQVRTIMEETHPHVEDPASSIMAV